MQIKKIYFNKMYNQWRGEPLYIKDDSDNYLNIRIMDIEYKKDEIKNIVANFKDLNNEMYIIQGRIDFEKRIVSFEVPTSILDNDGVYEVFFSILYTKDNKDTKIQTFEIFKDRDLNKHLPKRKWKLPDFSIRKERNL